MGRTKTQSQIKSQKVEKLNKSQNPNAITNKKSKETLKKIGSGKSRKQNFDDIKFQILDALQQIQPDARLSQSTLATMNTLIKDALDKVCEEAIVQNQNNKEQKLSGKTIKCTVQLILPETQSKSASTENTKQLSKHKQRRPLKKTVISDKIV
ncbi:hypothetical protein OXYTRIMIC_366 [Oxytricha trifallax]|uniref:Uncharacterized protein n=1 Tax=Oxytricha trifallax TaxID=1172189 RepID=A0A073HYN0_9SPIT|nr:hypothetical protein OXYTRIMIC_366 [Oxytricha trifallax]